MDGDIIDDDDYEDSEFDYDDENDPDWRKTPLFKRLEKSKVCRILILSFLYTSYK